MEAAEKPWPAMSIDEAYRRLTAPGAPFEMVEVRRDGVPFRAYARAPASLRAVFDAGRTWGPRTAFVHEDERLSFEGLYRAASALGRVLADEFGLAKGDRVAILMRNFPEWPVAFWAVAATGGVVVPLNAWGTGPEHEYALLDCGAKVAIADAERLTRLAPHAEALAALRFIGVRAATSELGRATALDRLIGPLADYERLPGDALPDPGLSPDDDATIFYTSGTTGRPKGALGSQRNICTNIVSVAFCAARAALRRGDPIPAPAATAPQRGTLLSVPLFHVTGCHSIMLPNYVNGGKIVLMRRWNAERALELIERERLNSFGGVPSMAWQVVESPDFARRDTSSIDLVSYGGAPSAPDLVARLRAAFPRAQPRQGYGLTETSALTSSNAGEDYVARPASVGRPVPICDVRIVDAEGRDVPAGSVGELWLKGANIVKGYWRKPEATAAAFENGWLKTGDLVRADEEGLLYVVDRAKDMLIRGGENVYCVEVEDALYTHPAVMDAAVVGIPHRLLGEEVGAVVQLAPGKEAGEEELKAHVAARLAAFKVPVRIDIRRDPLPRNANGKILKRTLRDGMKGPDRG